jgi:ribosome-binding protein aMBF1 (putative translation factor)
MAKEIRRVVRAGTVDERASHAEVRRQVEQEFPPLDPAREPSAKNRIAAAIRKARQDQGLTWETVAENAGIPNPMMVRDIEYGRDAKLSNVEAVAKALGLTLEFNEAS